MPKQWHSPFNVYARLTHQYDVAERINGLMFVIVLPEPPGQNIQRLYPLAQIAQAKRS